MRNETCDICWHKLNDPVTLTDADGLTMTVCCLHTLSADDLLSRVGSYPCATCGDSDHPTAEHASPLDYVPDYLPGW